jgi:Zn-dependent protease
MPSEIVLVVFYLVILLYSVIIHEVAHGVMAFWLGDPTAKYADRLNLNPVKHIDPWGSIMAPLLMLLLSNFRFAFGWAKPVPYNPYNLKNQKWGPALVALAGPGSNIALALIFSLAARLISIPASAKADIILNFNNWSSISAVVAGSFSSILFELCIIVIFWNVLLAFFNLIPIPPLDGSKLVFAVLPIKIETQALLEQFGFIFLLVFVIFFSGPLGVFLNLMLNIFLNIVM